MKLIWFRTIVVFSLGVWMLVAAFQDSIFWLSILGILFVFNALTWPVVEMRKTRRTESNDRLTAKIEEFLQMKRQEEGEQ